MSGAWRASLLFSCWCWHVGRERLWWRLPPPTYDSVVSPCFHGCLAFLHRHFPQQSPASYPFGPSPSSQQQLLPWNCSKIPMLQLPASVPSRGPTSLSGVCMAAARIVCVIFIPFRLSQISCLTFSLNCFFSDPDNSPNVVIGPLLQFPHRPRADPVLLTLLFFPPSFFGLLSFVWFYIFFWYTCLLSAGVLQALLCLKVYSWCIHGEICIPRPPIPLPSWKSNEFCR